MTVKHGNRRQRLNAQAIQIVFHQGRITLNGAKGQLAQIAGTGKKTVDENSGFAIVKVKGAGAQKSNLKLLNIRRLSSPGVNGRRFNRPSKTKVVILGKLGTLQGMAREKPQQTQARQP